ncbi:DsbA family protein [Staphylococcus xylosus]
MKKIKIIVFILGVMLIISACSTKKESEKNTENEIIVFGDYKCPYCKQMEEKIMPKLTNEYIKKDNTKFRFVNMAFLGKDSIKGSRAGHAVENISPNEYLKFQKNLYNKQPNSEKNWITNQLLDKEIKKLNISDGKKKKIIENYKSKDSQSWKDAKKDQELAEKKGVEEAPTVFINGKKVKNMYDFDEYKKNLEN